MLRMYSNLAHSYEIDTRIAPTCEHDAAAVSPSRYNTYWLKFTVDRTITGDTESQSYSLSDMLTPYYPRKT